MNFRLLRSNLLNSGWSSTIWIMVGTSSVSVTRSFWTVSMNCSALKVGSRTCVPPAMNCHQTPMAPAR
ncbi:hypothetical protein D3C71_2073450 [compost metagenome]